MNKKYSDYVVVSDVDGCLNTGQMHYTEQGKYIKVFGADDHDAAKVLSKYIDIHFLSADKKGMNITKKRIQEEMKFPLSFVSHEPVLRWQWIHENFPDKKVFFIGDGIFDFVCHEKCWYTIAFVDSLDHIKERANFVTKQSGGSRGFAEACIHIMKYLKIDWIGDINENK